MCNMNACCYKHPEIHFEGFENDCPLCIMAVKLSVSEDNLRRLENENVSLKRKCESLKNDLDDAEHRRRCGE